MSVDWKKKLREKQPVVISDTTSKIIQQEQPKETVHILREIIKKKNGQFLYDDQRWYGRIVNETNFILIEVWNSNATSGFSLKLAGQLEEPSGKTTSIDETMIPTSDKLVSTFYKQLMPGIIRSLLIYPTITTLQESQTFVRISLCTGVPSSYQRIEVLCSNYVTSKTSLSYPTSSLNTSTLVGRAYQNIFAVADPAVGANLLYTVPNNVQWNLVAINFTFVSSAVVANRRLTSIVTDGTDVLYNYISPTSQTASQTVLYRSGVNALTTLPSGVIVAPINLPTGNVVLPGYNVQVVVDNIQAGDQLSNVLIWSQEYLS